MTALASTFLIGSSLFFHQTRTLIKDWMSMKFCRIRPRTYELGALEHLEKSPWTNNGRNVVTTLVLSIFILADKKDNYKSLNEFESVKIPSPIMELALLDHLKN